MQERLPTDRNDTDALIGTYRQTLQNVRSIENASLLPLTGAIAQLESTGTALQYALPDFQDVLLLNRQSYCNPDPDTQLAAAAELYDRTITNIQENGYLPEDAKLGFQRQILTRNPEVSVMTSLMPTTFVHGEALSEPIRMYLPENTLLEQAFAKAADKYGLNEAERLNLSDAVEQRMQIATNPNRDMRVNYAYSRPFTEVGLACDGIKARLGMYQTHRTEDGDIVRFEGCNTLPAGDVLQDIADAVRPYTELAEPYRLVAQSAPKSSELIADIINRREASAVAFVEQLKDFAPETTMFSDEELIRIVKRTAESAQAYPPDVSPPERHVIDMMLHKDAGFVITGRKDNPDEPAVNRSDKPGPTEPHSLLSANGRTHEVTRRDYNAKPQFPFEGKFIAGLKYDRDTSAQLRQKMFETYLASS